MDVRLLEYFVSVAEEGSIHGGARRLLIAAPAVSKGLQRLERQFGCALLTRSPQGIDLTPAGVRLLAEARQILEQIGRAVAVVRETGRSQRKLAIGLVAGTVAAGDLTMDIMRTFRRQRPDVALTVRELSFAGHVDALVEGEVDVALVRPPFVHDQVDLIDLFDEPIVLCCRNDDELADADELSVVEVLDKPMLDMGKSPTVWASFWHLDQYRNGPARTASDMAVNTLAEMRFALECNSVVSSCAQSAWRLGIEGSTSPLRAIPFTDAPRSTVAMALRRGDSREDLWALMHCAQSVCQAMIDYIPGARVSAHS